MLNHVATATTNERIAPVHSCAKLVGGSEKGVIRTRVATGSHKGRKTK